MDSPPQVNRGESLRSLLSGLLIFVLLLGSVLALHYYIGHRLIGASGLTGGVAVLAWTLLWTLFACVPLAFVATRALPRTLALPIYWVAHLWIGIFGLLLTVVSVVDLVRVISEWIVGRALPAWVGPVQAAAVLGAVATAALYGFQVARGKPKVERIRVPIASLAPNAEGLRIVQISDVHIGETLDGRFLRRIVEQVNALNPDVVAITGDLVDGSVARLREEMKPLADLRALYGVFYVTGNHEYYHGGPAWEEAVRRLGVTVLHNAHQVIEHRGGQVVIAGVTDHDGGHAGPEHAPDVGRALLGAPTGVPRVLLAHQPRQAAMAKGHGVDLQLSGHTHGGQIFPFMFFVKLQQPTVSGLQKLHGFWLYTHRGTGYWGPPLRIGPSPEIAELTLVSA